MNTMDNMNNAIITSEVAEVLNGMQSGDMSTLYIETLDEVTGFFIDHYNMQEEGFFEPKHLLLILSYLRDMRQDFETIRKPMLSDKDDPDSTNFAKNKRV
jgi:hypothetical protein